MLAEKALESCNKNYKKYKLNHSRTHSHEVNIEDVFYKAMDSSDPIISSINFQSKNKKKSFKLQSRSENLFAILQENEECKI